MLCEDRVRSIEKIADCESSGGGHWWWGGLRVSSLSLIVGVKGGGLTWLRVMATAAEVYMHLLDRKLTYEHAADLVANGW